LDASSQREQTLIVFLFDHGMVLPFIKTQLYHHSTHTLLIIQVPGLTTPGSQERKHMIASTAIMPTLLEVLDLPAPQGMQGTSFKPLLTGAPLAGHEHVIKEYHMNSGGALNPMRAVQNQKAIEKVMDGCHPRLPLATCHLPLAACHLPLATSRVPRLAGRHVSPVGFLVFGGGDDVGRAGGGGGAAQCVVHRGGRHEQRPRLLRQPADQVTQH